MRSVPQAEDQDQPLTDIVDTDAVDDESQYFAIPSTESTADIPITNGVEEGNLVSVVVDDPIEQLISSLIYLRETYSYCLFCGCQYEDQDDMMASCPGINEEDHE